VDGDAVLHEKRTYHQEKHFKEVLGLLGLKALFLHQTGPKSFILTFPHPHQDVEYVLSSYRDRKQPREFADLGRCVQFALNLGVTSIHFRLHDAA